MTTGGEDLDQEAAAEAETGEVGTEATTEEKGTEVTIEVAGERTGARARIESLSPQRRRGINEPIEMTE